MPFPYFWLQIQNFIHFQTVRPYKFNHVVKVILARQPYKFKVHKNGLHSEKPISSWPYIQDCSPSSPWGALCTKASTMHLFANKKLCTLNCKFSGKGKNERNCKWLVSNNFTFPPSLLAVSFNHVFREANFVLSAWLGTLKLGMNSKINISEILS